MAAHAPTIYRHYTQHKSAQTILAKTMVAPQSTVPWGGRDNSEQGYSSVRPQPDPASGSGVPIDGLRGLPIRLQSGCQGPSRDHDSHLSVPEKFLGGPGSTHQVARFNNIRAKSSMLHTQQLQGYFFFFLFFFLSYLLFLSFYCLFLFLYSFFILLFLTFLLFLF